MLQRDGEWGNYLDGEANYHIRPGLWVTPTEGFEKGRLEVVEIPTNSETHDNIVAYWVPEAPLLSGESRYFAYTLKTVERNPVVSELATVIRTRQSKPSLPGEKVKDETKQAQRRFIVDFSSPDFSSPELAAPELSANENTATSFNPDTTKLIVQGSNGAISQQRLYPVNEGKEWRATFLLMPKDKSTVDMRAYIELDGKRISEVWNYVYQPK